MKISFRRRSNHGQTRSQQRCLSGWLSTLLSEISPPIWLCWLTSEPKDPFVSASPALKLLRVYARMPSIFTYVLGTEGENNLPIDTPLQR